jgi:transposase
VPFHRRERMEELLGIPLPAATQWDLVEETAALIQPVHEELIRQAAQGEVLHNDDTGMRVLEMERDPSDERTGVLTVGSSRRHPAERSRCILRGVSTRARTSPT